LRHPQKKTVLSQENQAKGPGMAGSLGVGGDFASQEGKKDNCPFKKTPGNKRKNDQGVNGFKEKDNSS